MKSEFGEVKVIPQDMEKYLSLTVARLNLSFFSVYSTRSRQSCEDSWKMKNLGTSVKCVPLIILDLFVVMVSIPEIIWVVFIDLKRLNCHLEMRSSANSLVVHAQIQNTHMRLECGLPSGNIYLQLDVLLLVDFFEKFRKTWNYIALIQYIITLLPVLHGMSLLECHLLNYSS